jgi:CheY-like chemotaxis protein
LEDTILSRYDGEGCYALVIEDAMLIALSLVEMLRDLGFERIEHAPTVARALALAADWRPDLITANVRLPDGTGLDAVEAIAARHGAVVPTVYITANPERLGCLPDAVVLGMPFRPHKLRLAVARAIPAWQAH